MSNVLNIDKKITIGTGDLELYLNVTLNATGEVLVDKKADSLVANFARILQSMMGSENIGSGLYFNQARNTTFPTMLADSGVTFEVVSAVTPGNPTRVTFNGNMTTFDNAGDQGLQFMGIGGIVPNINGFHPSADVTWISDSIADIAVDTTGSPAFVDEGARVRLWEDVGTRDLDAELSVLQYSGIVIGHDGSIANVTDQQCLNNEFDAGEGGALEPFEVIYNSPKLALPTFNVATGVSELFLSSIITNNTGNTIDVDEIGWYVPISSATNNRKMALIARDTVIGVTLAQGESATVSYRLQTKLAAHGGILKPFIQMLYRQLSQILGVSNITVRNIQGNDISDDAEEGIFHTVGLSGSGYLQNFESGFTHDFLGVQVGTGTTAVVLGDYALETRVAQGEASGELRSYGEIIQNFNIAGSVASFDIVKYFENVSGGTITIGEVGIYSVTDEIEGSVLDIACIYREVLGATQAVLNGEIVKIVISFELTVA